MREIFKGFLMLRLLALIPLVVFVVVVLGVSALTGRSQVLGIVILASVTVVAVAVLGWLLARRARHRHR